LITTVMALTMGCGWCRGGQMLVHATAKFARRKLSSAKAYLMREAPDLTEPIAELHTVMRQYNSRIDELERRKQRSHADAHACMVDYKRNKNPATRASAMQHLRTKSMTTKHAASLRQRLGVLSTHMMTMEEAGMQSSTVAALQTTSRALKLYGRAFPLHRSSCV